MTCAWSAPGGGDGELMGGGIAGGPTLPIMVGVGVDGGKTGGAGGLTPNPGSAGGPKRP